MINEKWESVDQYKTHELIFIYLLVHEIIQYKTHRDTQETKTTWAIDSLIHHF